MYHAVIGKKVVEIYNKTNKSNLSVKEFWLKEFWPVFYNHNIYLLSGGNTPLENPKQISKVPQKIRREKLLKNAQIGTISTINSLVAPSDDNEQTTSGQVSNLKLPMDEEDILATWLGVACGIRTGKECFLIDDENVIHLIMQGWKKYRELINQYGGKLKGNQIETWNAHWLSFVLKNSGNYKNVTFIPELKSKDQSFTIPVLPWIKVIFRLAQNYPEKEMLLFAYGIGQMNTTIGFIKLKLPEVKREIDMYAKLFTNTTEISSREIYDVYETENSFMKCCEAGNIGITQIQPKGLEEYVKTWKNKKTKQTTKNNEHSLINYFIYISWINAMINSENIMTKSEEATQKLLDFVNADSRRTVADNLVNTLFESTNRNAFIETLTRIITNNPESSDFFYELVKDIDKLPVQTFRYFVVLLNFHYKHLLNKRNKK